MPRPILPLESLVTWRPKHNKGQAYIGCIDITARLHIEHQIPTFMFRNTFIFLNYVASIQVPFNQCFSYDGNHTCRSRISLQYNVSGSRVKWFLKTPKKSRSLCYCFPNGLLVTLPWMITVLLTLILFRTITSRYGCPNHTAFNKLIL